MKLGFTGTRKGMTPLQRAEFRRLLDDLKPTEFHHGDCVGADAQAHNDARDRGIRTVLHPPKDSKFRAFMNGNLAYSPKPYIHRNHDIVDATDTLVVAPKERKEITRGGTWATKRYAKSLGKRVIVIPREPPCAPV